MEGTKKAEVSGWSEAYNKRLKRLLRNEVSARVNDPNTVKNLMRHTSLNTTTLYTRTVTERMKDAVKDLGKPLEASLGGKSGSNSLRKKTQNSTLVKLAIKELIARRAKGNSGGRSRNRTYDLAHVRRADSESNLIELLTELLLGAGAGGNADDPEGLQ